MKMILGRDRVVMFLTFFLFMLFAACSSSQQGQEGMQEQVDQGQESSEEATAQEEDGNYGNQEEAVPNIQENISDDVGFGDQTGTSDELANFNNYSDPSLNAAGGQLVPNSQIADAGMPQNPGIAADSYTAAGVEPAAAEPMLKGVGGKVTGVAGIAAGNGLPEMGSKMAYMVVKGDTLGGISAKIYGKKNRWREIAEWSGIVDPNRIYPGDVIYYQLSEQTLAFASRYENAAQVAMTVSEGETIGSVAKEAYGSEDLWPMVWRQNGQLSHPDQLKAGTVIYVKSLTEKPQIETHTKSIVEENDSDESFNLSAVIRAMNSTKNRV